MPRRTSRILAVLGSPQVTIGESLEYAKGTLPQKLSLFTSRLPLLSMLNVKYLISAYELPSTLGLVLATTTYSTRFNIPIYLYENTRVLPRVYLAQGVTFAPDIDELKNFERVTATSTDFSKTTLIECPACTDLKNIPARTDTLKITDYRDGYLMAEVNIALGRWLIFSESNLPGWQIILDGTRVQAETANYLFQGLYIPPGSHRVKWEYGGIPI